MPKEDLKACISSLPVAAYICDSEGRIIAFNRRAEHLWGKAPVLRSQAERYCGAFLMLSPDGTPIQPEHSLMARVLKTAQGGPGEEFMIQSVNGQRVWVLMNATPLLGNSGKITGALATLTEIGEQKETQKKLENKFKELQRTELLIHQSHEEEQRLAMHFLHEDVGQRLTGIALMAGVIQKSLSRELHPLAKKAAEVSKLTGGCIALASDLAKGIYPLNIEVDGLPVALEFLAHRAEAHYKVSCKLLRNGTCQCAPELAIHIYRMVQIAILTAIKRYGASSITVLLSDNKKEHCIAVDHDLGTKEMKSSSQIGSEDDLLKSRARLIHAKVKIRELQNRNILISWPAT